MNVSCGAHLGDIIWIANMLSKLPEHHVFSMPKEYHREMNELLAGLDIELTTIEEMSDECRANDCWIANGRFEQSHGLRYQNDIDIIGFVMKYMNAQCEVSGHAPVFNERQDFLCSFPALESDVGYPTYDVMMIVADPKSGQCPQYSGSEMEKLRETLIKSMLTVATASQKMYGNEYTIRDTGSFSIEARLIIGPATGPLWATFNIWNKDAQRIVLLEPQRLDYGIPVRHAANAAQVEEILKETGWL